METKIEKSGDILVVVGDIGMTTVSRSDFYFKLDLDEEHILVSSTVDNIEIPIQCFGDVDATEVFQRAYMEILTSKANIVDLAEIVDSVLNEQESGDSHED